MNGIWIANHHHRHGTDTYLFRMKNPEHTPSEEDVVAPPLEVDYEAGRDDEWIEFDYIDDRDIPYVEKQMRGETSQ